MNNVGLIDKTELKLREDIEEAHKRGLTYWRVLFLFLKLSEELYLRAEAEYQVNKS